VIFIELPKVNNVPIGENSLNLVTLSCTEKKPKEIRFLSKVKYGFFLVKTTYKRIERDSLKRLLENG
jgi:hypothetical protein